MIRQATPASLMRNSWHRGPIEGIGLEWGIPSISPRCNRRSKSPASNLAPAENGGVFISPSNQTSGLSTEATTQLYVISDMTSIRFDFRERVRSVRSATYDHFVSASVSARVRPED